jgi:hypothetical protein
MATDSMEMYCPKCLKPFRLTDLSVKLRQDTFEHGKATCPNPGCREDSIITAELLKEAEILRARSS